MSAPLVPAVSDDRPFPGLRPFDSADADFFFGRTEHIYSLYRLVDRSRFVAVVGGSGSGKSSLVRAGLLHILDQETKGSGGRNWIVRVLRPGAAPIDALAHALADLASSDEVADTSALRQRIRFDLERSSYGVADALARIAPVVDPSILLVVDQFEELFRYGRGSRRQRRLTQAIGEADKFVQLLLEATRGQPDNVRVLLTMRSDFIGDCADFQGLPEAVSACQFLVPSLTRNQLEEAIRDPIEKAHSSIEPGLVETLLRESAPEEDQLPLLQHCLLRMWEAAGRPSAAPSAKPDGTATSPASPEAAAAAPPRHITADHYERVGRIANALSQHAEDVLLSVKDVETAVEQMFRALSDTDKDNRATRRAIALSQLQAEAGVPEADLRRALDRFRADDCLFLLPSITAAPTLRPDATIDVAHEALLRRWERISGPREDTTAGLTGEPPGWLAAEDRDGQRYQGILSMLGTKSGPFSALALMFMPIRWWRTRPRTQEWADRHGGQFSRVQGLLQWARMMRWAAAVAALAIVLAGGAMSYKLIKQREAEDLLARNFRNTVAMANTFLSDINRLETNGNVTVAGAKQMLKTAQEAVAKVSMDLKTPETTALAANFRLSASDLMVRLGDIAEALQTARDARNLEQPFFKAEPKNPDRLLLMYHATLRVADAISEQNLGSQSHLDALAEYREAQVYVDTLVRLAPKTTAYIRRQAVVHQKIGDIRLAQNDGDAALAEFLMAVKRSNDVIALDPDLVGGHQELATSLDRVAQAYTKLNKAPEAEKQLRLSLSIRKELLAKHANDPVLQSHVAASHINLARLLMQSGDLATAAAELDLGIAIREQLAANDTSNMQRQSFLAAGYVDKAKLLRRQHDLVEALALYNKVLTIRHHLAGAAPRNITVRQNLAETKSAVAGTLAEMSQQSDAATSRWSEAIRMQRDSLAIWQDILTEMPGNITALRKVFANHIAIGDMLAAQNNQADALTEYDAALAVVQPLADKAPNSSWANDVATAKGRIDKLPRLAGGVH